MLILNIYKTESHGSYGAGCDYSTAEGGMRTNFHLFQFLISSQCLFLPVLACQLWGGSDWKL